VPAFADAAAAARALAAALHRSEWLRRDRTPVRPPAGIRPDLALDVVINAVAERPDGGRLTTARAIELAKALGLRTVDTTLVPPAHDAVRSMSATGVEYLVEVTSDPVWGPLLAVWPATTGDRAHCLVPPTEHDLDHVLAGGTAEVRAVVGDCAARAAWLVDRFPEIAQARINLIVADGQGLAVEFSVRLAPATEADPHLPAIPE
jgi:hypothetical protein